MPTQSLNTVVKIGAVVDKAGFNQIGKTFNKAMGNSVKAVKKLEREQKNLAKQIKKTEKAGGDIRELTREYDRLGREIAQASRKAKAFQMIQRRVGGGYRKITRAAKVGGTAAGLAGGAVVGAVLMANNETAKMAAEASSYGVSATTFSVWGDMAEDMKMAASDFGKMGVDMRKKIGKFLATGQGANIGETFEKLGLDPKELQGKSVAAQLDLIIGRLEQVGDATKQAGFADILIGSKSIRTLTALNEMGETWKGFYKSKADTNLLSNKGAEGAKKFAFNMGTAFNAITTGWADVSGLIGGHFAQSISDVTTEFSDWYKLGGRKTIVKNITSAIDSMIEFKNEIGKTVREAGGWKVVMGKIATVLKLIAVAWAVVKVAVIVTAISQLIFAVGTLATAFGALAVSIISISWPVLAVIGLVGLLAAGAFLVWKDWDWVVGKLTQALDYFTKRWNDDIEWISKTWDEFATPIGKWWDLLPDKVKKVGALVKTYFKNIFGDALADWNKFTDGIGAGFKKFKDWFGIGSQQSTIVPIKPPPVEIPRNIAMASQTRTTNHISNVGTINVATQPGQSPRDFANELEKTLIRRRCGNNFDFASPV